MRTLTAGRVIVVLAIAAAAFLQPQEFLRSYLFAVLFVLGLSLGALANLMMHAVTGGRWGEAIRAPLLAAAANLPLTGIMFIPLLAGLPYIYEWLSQPAAFPGQTWWLNRPFFIGRQLLYFAIWCALAAGWRAVEHRSADPRPAALRRTSALGLILYLITASLAAVDWIVSLTPRWYSTGFGLLVITSQALAAFALALAWTARTCASRQIRRDLGNLLLTYVMMWAYLAFTQFLIVWAEDLPREISWYLPRLQTNWRWLSLALMMLQFALPFVVLLSRAAKESPRILGALASAIVVVQLAFAFYLVVPTLRPHGIVLKWTDGAVVLLVVGWWFIEWRNRMPPSVARMITDPAAA